MANFNLPFGVRVSNNNPLDAERYVVADVTTRDALLSTPVRAYEGLQVYVESEKNLYILKDVDLSTWELVGGGTSYLSTLLDVSIGADISAGYVLVYDPSANDVSKWYAVEPINAADIFIPEVSFNDAYFKWVGGLIEPSVQGGGGGGTVGWANDVVGSNNQLLTAAGDGSIVAESHFTFNGSSLVIDADVSILLNSGAGNTKGIQIYWAGVPGTLIDDNQIRCVSTNGDFYIQNGSDTNGNTNIGSLYGRTTILNDACIGGDLYVTGLDNTLTNYIVYYDTASKKLTYGNAPDSSLNLLYVWNNTQDSSIVALRVSVNNASTFLGLYDTPDSYSAGKLVAVNDASTGLEFVPRIWRESNNEITVDDPCSNVLFYDYIELEADAGVATLIEKNITSSAGNTEQGYKFNLDGSTQLKVYGVANGSGALDGSQGIAVMNYFYIGDPALAPATNKCWRLYIADDSSNGKLMVEKRDTGGKWIESGKFE